MEEQYRRGISRHPLWRRNATNKCCQHSNLQIYPVHEIKQNGVELQLAQNDTAMKQKTMQTTSPCTHFHPAQTLPPPRDDAEPSEAPTATGSDVTLAQARAEHVFR